ncbi:MAG: hypothetical protein CfP315_0314 [Candidatus Improbicoccus pseudotrichonymphae]|uniref:Uncharacterized protein n=1 Tax=Candidatus Improbicoccus pseudotrichonymphae TaxID=3033792 RepID=A0AA48L0T0_9FIRM|nr:MAG: hypothetical protein CfP315_0314 [Candidatus Improbicoccus pseudotrichonymphae]
MDRKICFKLHGKGMKEGIIFAKSKVIDFKLNDVKSNSEIEYKEIINKVNAVNEQRGEKKLDEKEKNFYIRFCTPSGKIFEKNKILSYNIKLEDIPFEAIEGGKEEFEMFLKTNPDAEKQNLEEKKNKLGKEIDDIKEKLNEKSFFKVRENFKFKSEIKEKLKEISSLEKKISYLNSCDQNKNATLNVHIMFESLGGMFGKIRKLIINVKKITFEGVGSYDNAQKVDFDSPFKMTFKSNVVEKDITNKLLKNINDTIKKKENFENKRAMFLKKNETERIFYKDEVNGSVSSQDEKNFSSFINKITSRTNDEKGAVRDIHLIIKARK